MIHSSVHVGEAGWYRGFQFLATAFCYIGGLLPLGWLLAFYALLIRIRFAAGAWPASSWEKTSLDFSFPFHERLVTDAILILPFFFLPWSICSAGFSLCSPAYLPFARYVYLLSIWPLAFLFVIIDPGEFMYWFFLSSD